MQPIVATMIVFNEEEYLPYSLRSIYDYVDKIVIVEGAIAKVIKSGFAGENGKSIDKTCEIIDKFPDPKKKIVIEHGKFKHKNDQRNHCLKHVPLNSWILVVDGDEIYSKRNIQNLITLTDRYKNYEMIIYPMYHFYDYDKHIEMIKYVERLFVYRDGMHYPDADAGQAIRDKSNRPLWIDPFYTHKKIFDNAVCCHHYSRMKNTKDQVERMAYYYMRDSGLPLEKAMELAKKDPTTNHKLNIDKNKLKVWDPSNHPEVIKETQKYKDFMSKYHKT